jgi:hypothetical protein
MFFSIILQETQVAQKGIDAFEKITNPILILLLLVLIGIIILIWKYFRQALKDKDALIKEKEVQMISYINAIMDINKADARLIADLRSTLEKLTDADKIYASKLGVSNDLLQQLIAKIDSLLKINK